MQSMKHFTSLFDAPIWSHDHAGVEEDKLKDFILDLKSKDKGRIVSNNQGWQSNPLHLQTPELQQFFQAVLIDLNYYYKSVKGHTDKYEVMIEQAWANVNTTGAFNWPHAHTGFLSVVYYVEADEDTGMLRFIHPSILMRNEWQSQWFKHENTSCTASSWNFTPKTNRCFIFPSWLEHLVDINNTSKTRISIALNTTIVKV